MSAIRARSRHRDQPPSSSRWWYYEGEVNGRPTSERTSHSTPHRCYSSPQQRSHHSRGVSSPRQGLGRFAREPYRCPMDDYTPEDGALPLRRQSTQPPRRRSSPTSHLNGDYEQKWVYHRRAVEPTSPRRHLTERKRYSSPRHAAPVNHTSSTAPAVAENGKRAPPRRSARASPNGSPRRSHRQREASQLGHDSGVRIFRQRHGHSSASPHRSHGPVGSPSRHEHRAPSSHRPRHASTDPQARSPRGSAQRHRHSGRARPASPALATEATRRHDPLRHRSSYHGEVAAKSEATPHRSRKHSRSKRDCSAEKEAYSPARHASAHRSRSSRPESRRHSERRRRQHHTATPESVREGSRHSCHIPLLHTLSEDRYALLPPSTESKHVRSAANSHTHARPRSGSYIEVISVHSARQGSTNGWSHSHSSAPHSPRRPREDSPAVVISSPRGQKIMQRIDSTRHWIQKMKEEVKKDRESVLQEGEGAAHERSARRSLRKEHRDSTTRAESARRHRTSSAGSRRETQAAAPQPASADAQVASRRYAYQAIPVGVSSDEPRRASEQPAPPTHGTLHNSSRRSAETTSVRGPTPRTPTPNLDPRGAAVGTVESSREGGVDSPIFFMSFLDGNTFDSTARLCQYNVDLADSLSDEHLGILRAAVFDNNEEAFAELLYGDDVEAEIGDVAATLGPSEDPVVQRELVLLQRAAVRRFNDKCAKALQMLLSADGGLGEAVQVAASQRERQAYQVEGPAMVVS
ncbi:hypothetical protein LSCM1_00293 [Leishmania martiniquensis]|uniref:Uncharacterized protein n=1 Tax=Leishmania martiniquensis TaxID=1580590 RepID=A0A836GU03_9TRYP|nr:hypothetical protein LSCM1_00293 [Leishmania martiniquensis]